MSAKIRRNPQPDVPLPAGATADWESWAFWGNQFRTFHGVHRFVLDSTRSMIAGVHTEGVQLPDGTVDSRNDPPAIYIDLSGDGSYDSAQVRKLAELLLEAAAEVEQWLGGSTTDGANSPALVNNSSQ